MKREEQEEMCKEDRESESAAVPKKEEEVYIIYITNKWNSYHNVAIMLRTNKKE